MLLSGGGEGGEGEGEVLKFGFGRDVLQNLIVDPFKYQFFKKSDPIMYLLAILEANFKQNQKIFPKFS